MFFHGYKLVCVICSFEIVGMLYNDCKHVKHIEFMSDLMRV